ncbi:uncharacterized protein BT62DRAFT_926382 [Guyanagaster necrorhizus]|uniref:Uncharacterized protein n=1 Tax=Guyanagaster necrorhizus TaxID=856835 RepID=A0A9P7W2J8_9AGAR|nr:uncharacterized protein BT62DRAFT_926382 [Guyanagaster necrorhizus MCA 3950]KAG7452161.1 hypothetical protein BT62DRAFT_926382 [Guyanagaster necrorhizus MCA 3950]
MAPKPRGARKASTSSRDGPFLTHVDKNLKAMPPPPDPVVPKRILEQEMEGLKSCFRNTMVKMGRLYAFYADTRRLGIRKYAPYPPRSLSASLGREIENYDQLCDSMESHLVRAIAVLERDLRREEQRLKEAEEAALASQAHLEEPILSPSSNRLPMLPPDSDSTLPSAMPSSSPPISSVMQGRRPSAISISSLQRPAFPLKLDLSSSSLRMSAEEAAFLSNGLHSPVTLAPKSARPLDYPVELMAAFTSEIPAAPPNRESANNTIDLTIEPTERDVNINMDGAIGSSADKPIELDLGDMDMSDLFGDNSSNDAVDSLFSPTVANPELAAEGVKEEQHFLNTFAAANGSATEEEFFSSLSSKPENEQSSSLEIPSGDSAGQTAPSPGTFLASLTGSQLESGNEMATSSGSSISMPEGQFSMESLGYGFFANDQDSGVNLDALLAMGNEGVPVPDTKAESSS